MNNNKKINLGILIKQLNDLNGKISYISLFDSVVLTKDPSEIIYPNGYSYKNGKIINEKNNEVFKIRVKIKKEENKKTNLIEQKEIKLLEDKSYGKKDVIILEDKNIKKPDYIIENNKNLSTVSFSLNTKNRNINNSFVKINKTKIDTIKKEKELNRKIDALLKKIKNTNNKALKKECLLTIKKLNIIVEINSSINRKKQKIKEKELINKYEEKLQNKQEKEDELNLSYELLDILFDNFLKSLNDVEIFSKEYNKKLDYYSNLFELLTGDKTLMFSNEEISLDFERFGIESEDFISIYKNTKNNLDAKKEKQFNKLSKEYDFYIDEKERNIDLENELMSISDEIKFYEEKELIKKYIRTKKTFK